MSLVEMFGLESLLVWVLLGLTGLYFWSTHTYGLWSSLGVPFRKPVPLFGNIFRAVCNLETTFKIQQDICNMFKDSPLVGIYHFMTPKLFIKDPYLIEHVMVRDFSTFMDRGTGVDPDRPGMNAHLINLTGQRWRSLRNKLSPVFTSGKMKGMMEQLEACAARLVNHLREESRRAGPLEAKYQLAGFTLDVIGSCAFGLDFNAIDDPDSTFRQIGERIFGPSRTMVVKRWMREHMPRLFEAMRKETGKLNIQEYFTGLIKNTMKYREENRIHRQDFVQLMMELRRQEDKAPSGENEVLLTDNVLTSNCFVFLLAGYETTASTLSFLLYELAVNQDVQERLYREVTKVLRRHDGVVSWESLKDMNYLEQVTSETLRKYPPATELRRLALKPYTFPKSGLQIPAGTLVSIPVYSLHHNPLYFPEPERFDPERFSEANRHKLVKYTYLPFGEGPRICIGVRFALMEIKIAVTKLIQEFTVKLNPRTVSPLQMDPGAFLLGPIGGIWLDFKTRDKQSL